MSFTYIRSALALVGSVSVTGSASAAVYTFSGGPITIPPFGKGNPYPRTIVVAGIPPAETVLDVDVIVTNYSHAFPEDTGALVTNPGGGQPVVLFNGPGDGAAASALTWVFDDAAATRLPFASDPLVSGTFRPSNEYPDDPFDPPAPAGPYSTNLATLKTGSPNGTWSLYVQDFSDVDAGSIGGWGLRIETTNLITILPSVAIKVSGTDLVISGTNGVPGSTNYVLTATNIALPLSNWTRLSTNVFDSNGIFAFTNAFSPAIPQSFYLLQLP